MRRSFDYFVICCVVLCVLAKSVSGQDPDKAEALVRHDPTTNEYFIVVRTYAAMPENGTVSATLANKKELISWEGDVPDCGTAYVGRFCKRFNDARQVEIIYRPILPPTKADKYKVNFAIADSKGKGSFRTLDVTPDYKLSDPRLAKACHDGVNIDLETVVPADDAQRRSLNERMKSIGEWLGPLQRNPADLAKVQIEPMKSPTTDIQHPKVSGFEVFPSVLTLETQKPTGQPVARISMCMHFDQSLPPEKFNVEIAFPESAPIELRRNLAATLTGAGTLAAPDSSALVAEEKLGLRAFENNLDVGLVFISSVKTETTKKRSSTGTLDLRFAPSLLGRGRPPRTKTWQPFWTPFFIDAKISNGKIDNDTLSLNRILFGTELVFRYYESTAAGKRNRYLLTLRGTNASDRDYKRAEITGELEFRPIFDRINRPLKRSPSQFIPSVIVPDGPPREVTTSKIFGYQIQPFVGVEAGRTYRDRRSVLKGEEVSKTVRRLYFGTDMAFDVTSHFTLSFTDMLYLRGESGQDRLHNYFIGKIEVPLGNLWRQSAQSVYFSFERGGQPPFSTPDVNALKVGYRVRSNFFRLGTSQ